MQGRLQGPSDTECRSKGPDGGDLRVDRRKVPPMAPQGTCEGRTALSKAAGWCVAHGAWSPALLLGRPHCMPSATAE